jgi:WD40 repeat protein
LSAPTEVIGPYRILGLLGAGGMGEVYLAEQSRPLRRRVAVKIIKRGMDTEQVIARFESERQALALMNHPNIARVFDAGEQDGRPYFVMEYVPGIPITEYCDRQRLTTRERLALFAIVCHAVQHAHQKGIIHRDLKPSNVLVSVQDGQPVPKVIDFGVAKAIDQRLTERTLFTQHGLLVGTPEYMSPEQAEMTGLDVDTRTDVYSLGVLLYELLVGALPFDAQALRRAGFDEMRRMIREDDPVKPSTRVSSLGEKGAEIAKRRQTDLKSLGRQLRGDLEWITLKALEKDRTRRYSTASEFAGDIERHLAGDPVLAGPPGIAYRTQKLVLKHRRAAAGLAFGAVGLAIAAAISTGLYVRSERFRRAEEWQSYVANVRAAAAALEEGATVEARRRLEAAPERLRNWEWYYLWERLDSSFAVLSASHGPVRGVHFSPDGSRIISYTENTVDEWNASTRALVRSTRRGGSDETIVSVSPDGSKAVLQRRTGDESKRTPHVVRVDTGETLVSLHSDAMIESAQWTHDGRRILVQLSKPDGWNILAPSLQLWDIERKAPTTTVESVRDDAHPACRPYAISRNGRYFAALTRRHISRLAKVIVFDITGKQIAIRDSEACSLTFDEGAESGDLLVENASAVEVWDFLTGVVEKTLRAPDRPDALVARHAIEEGMFSASDTAVVRSIDSRPAAGIRYGHTRRITAMALSPYGVALGPDGTTLATSSEDGTVRLWTTSRNTSGSHRLLEGLSNAWRVESNGGRLLAVGAGGLEVSDPASGRRLIRRGMFESLLRNFTGSAALSADGTHVAAADDPAASGGFSQMVVLDIDSERVTKLTGHPTRVDALAFAPSGERLVSGSSDGIVRAWNVQTGALLRAMDGRLESITSMAVSPDGRYAAAGSLSGEAVIWDIDRGTRLSTLSGHTHNIVSVVFSTDGSRLLTGSIDGTVRMWDPMTGNEMRRLAHTGPVTAVRVNVDGTRVLSSSLLSERNYDGGAKIWDFASGELLLTIRTPGLPLTSVTFTSDGQSVVFSDPTSLGVWETRAARREKGTQ